MSGLLSGEIGRTNHAASGALWLGETWAMPLGNWTAVPNFVDGVPVPDGPTVIDRTWLVGGDAVPGRPTIGVPSVLVTTMVDVRSQLDAKRAAIAAHASQVPETSSAMTMPAATFADVYGFEWYVRTGPPGLIDQLD